MDQGLLNFWKNYENVINWGYRITGAEDINACESTVPINMQASYFYDCSTNLVDEEYLESNDDSHCSNSSDDIDLEYLKFSKKTLEHQEKIEREKRKVDKEYGLCNSSNSDDESSKTIFVDQTNPKELYGSKLHDIVSLENKLQSEFDSFCSIKKPVLWPGMAFNLSVPEPELHLDLEKLSHPFLE